MADTRSHHAHAADVPTGPVEGDGIQYRALLWFGVILAATTLASMAIVWGMFAWMQSREAADDPGRGPVAAPAGQVAPGPGLIVDEPGNLAGFRARETHRLTTYGWADEAAGVVYIPIDEAKAKLLEEGLPVREAVAADEEPAAETDTAALAPADDE